jgi:neutral ceramidase
MNANIVKVAGPVNEAVPVLMAIDAKTKKPFGCFTSFDMHVAVFGGTKYGACYPGALQKALRETYGNDFISVFGEGCAGDINHVNVSKKEKDFDSVEIGNKLAETIVKTKREAITHSALFSMAIKVDCPLKADRSAELPAMRERLIGKDFAKVPFLEQVEACQVHMTEHLRKRDGGRAAPEIHAFRLADDLAIVTLPHEVFVELGLDIKKQSPFKHTFVITLANDVDCYIPTRKAFAEGSYEVTNSPYAPGVGELLVNAAVGALKDLKK